MLLPCVLLDIEQYSSTVLSYINVCTSDNVCTTKQIKIFPSQKPWFNNGVRPLLRAPDNAFRSGDREAYSRARAALKRGINTAKKQYRQRIEDNFRDNNSRTMWQGIRNQTISRARIAHPCQTPPSPTSLMHSSPGSRTAIMQVWTSTPLRVATNSLSSHTRLSRFYGGSTATRQRDPTVFQAEH